MPRQRLGALDALRGVVMLLMVLDHARDYFAPTRMPPEFLVQTDPLWFLTRWITHFCAPVFVLLAGSSIYLRQFGRASEPATPRGRPGMSRYLVARGLWLVVLECTVIGASWGFLFAGVITFQVIWALGVSMLVMGVLVACPWQASLVFGAITVVLHNLLDPITAAGLSESGRGALAPIWMALHEQGFVSFRADATQEFTPPGVFFVYPLIPWIGVMPLGYALGRVMLFPARARQRWCLAIGAAAIVAFFLLRLTGAYGEPSPMPGTRPGRSLLTLLNTTKYPPSLQFLLMTLGPALAAIPLMERLPEWGVVGERINSVLTTFGRVPLFFYVLHIPLLHGASAALWYALYGVVTGWQINPQTWPPGYEPRLWVAYLAALGAAAILYRPCRWYSSLRARSGNRWLSYL